MLKLLVEGGGRQEEGAKEEEEGSKGEESGGGRWRRKETKPSQTLQVWLSSRKPFSPPGLTSGT